MSKNGNAKAAGKASPKGGSAFRFLNYSLRADDKVWLQSHDTETELPDTALDDLVAQGYKYSLSYQEAGDCFVASITDRVETSPHHNVCLTGRGSTARNARVSLLYRHLVVCDGDWTILDRQVRESLEIF